MDAADVLYGVSMGGDGVTRVVSRRLPREAQGEAPRPFAGIGEEAEAEEGIGVSAAARGEEPDSAEAA
jgi:chromosome segregation protein